MKVLWFTNTPSLGSKYLNVGGVGGGWIESLESELNKVPNIELGIAFNYDKTEGRSFTIDNSKYFPVLNKKKKGAIKKFYHRWSHRIDTEDHLQDYLKIIHEFKPDIIHMFGTETDYGLITTKTNIPCVIHIQGNLTVYGHKWYSGLTALEVIKYSKKWSLLKGHGLMHDYYTNKKMAEREYRIFQGSQYLLGRTDWDKRISSVLSPKSKYFHCDEIMRPNFCLHQWRPKSTNISYTIITTIRRNIYKGLETIFDCKKILKQNFPSFNVIWEIAGITEEDEISYLVERKNKAKFKDYNIQLLGPLQENALINKMIGADLFVHPSHIDNSPNSVCEAMILGMPVIATYAGGTPSILSDKIEGLLVQDGDPYALAGAIMELIRDKKYACSLGSNARIKSMKRNDPETILNNLLEIYNSVISEN